MMNKKGDEKNLMLLWFMFVIVITGVIISGAVISFYGANADVRDLESRILVEKISDCFIYMGNLKEGSLKDDFNIFKECDLNEDSFSDGSAFFARIKFYDLSGKERFNERKIGLFELENYCESLGDKSDKYVKCKVEKIRVNYDGEILFFEILTASDNKGGIKFDL